MTTKTNSSDKKVIASSSRKILQFIFLVVSVGFIIFCTNEIATRATLLEQLESREIALLQELNSLRSSDNNLQPTKEPLKNLETNLAVTNLMITETKTLISQGVSQNLNKEEIIQYFTATPDIAYLLIVEKKKAAGRVNQLRSDVESLSVEILDIEDKLIKANSDSYVSQDYLKNIDSQINVLKGPASLNFDSIFNDIMNTLDLVSANIFEEETVKAAEYSPKAYLIILNSYSNRLRAVIKDYEKNIGTLKNSKARKTEEKNAKLSELESKLRAPQTAPSIYKRFLKYADLTLLPSSFLLAILFMSSGITGTVILTVRNADYFFETKTLMVGFSTGLIIYLGVKSAPTFFIDIGSSYFKSINVYSCALFGIISGLFSEKIYSVLNALTSHIEHKAKDKLNGSNDDIPNPPPETKVTDADQNADKIVGINSSEKTK